jgi:hypothetical protein
MFSQRNPNRDSCQGPNGLNTVNRAPHPRSSRTVRKAVTDLAHCAIPRLDGAPMWIVGRIARPNEPSFMVAAS